MIKKIIAFMMILSVSLFAINLQTASKTELMGIKGIGEVKATAIMKYRKSHKLKSAADLKGVDGIGEGIIKNVKNNVKVKSPSNTSSTKSKAKVKKATDKKESKRSKKLKESKAKVSKKVETKKSKAKKAKKKLKKKK